MRKQIPLATLAQAWFWGTLAESLAAGAVIGLIVKD